MEMHAYFSNIFQEEIGFLHIYIYFILLFRQMGMEGEREGEKCQCVVASSMPPTGDLAHNQACALIGNQTGNPLVCRPVLNPLSHTSQGRFLYIDLY